MTNSWAQVGKKCVAVASNWRNERLADTCPTKGQILTIREMEMDPLGQHLYLRFEEIRNPTTFSGKEPAFCVEGFRPLVTLEEDLKLFTKHLIGVNVDA